ncbi:MAG TPA: STAS domain-containing protein [Candidatus Glassbacteria bacterium]|nr:STAS domain-containing protein [Candidatus Glassbacteria bacterium]
MTITTHEVDDIAIAEVKGQINFQNTQTLKDLFCELEAKNHKAIVVDLKETEYIDGFGLSVLVNISRNVYKGGGRLSLSSLNRELQRIFTKTKLDRWFDIYDSQEEACRQMRKSNGRKTRKTA